MKDPGPRGDRGARPAGRVWAAGGVVWRPSASGGIEVLTVHRPAYDDWSFPKGHRVPGESDESCARREVEEETGLRCALGVELAPNRYVDRKQRDKRVRWWTMTVVGGRERAADDEVDDLRWSRLDEVGDQLTHDRDREVLRSFLAVQPGGAGQRPPAPSPRRRSDRRRPQSTPSR